MTGPDDRLPPEGFALAPEGLSTPLDEDAGPVSLFQEINERRSSTENAELLRHLRGL